MSSFIITNKTQGLGERPLPTIFPIDKHTVPSTRPAFSLTLNLSFLNLEHVISKQLQININYTFMFVFLFHVLILKAEKQLFPRCKPLFVI
jgi:hypothetical protein